jgi:hypothetical protein
MCPRPIDFAAAKCYTAPLFLDIRAVCVTQMTGAARLSDKALESYVDGSIVNISPGKLS